MPRRAALEALERFRRDSAWSRQVMGSLVNRYALDERDGALASRLFYGVLQNLFFCDHYIDLYAKGRLEPKVRDILRLGVYQLVFMDKIPPSAAVNESVKLCQKLGYSRASGLVNAVLRKIGAQRTSLPPIPGEGTGEYLSIRYSHPKWLVEELIALRGYEGAEAVLQADNTEPPVYIQVNTCRTTAEQLCRELDARQTPHGLVLSRAGDITATDAFQKGLFYVQDPAAHSVVEAAELKPGMRVLDTCAAPGGKSFGAAIAMGDQGTVLARDIVAKKLALVAQSAERMGLSSITCQPGDARDISGGDYDVVFADLPCSGMGVIRKKPDIRYHSQEELAGLPELQSELLESAATAVKPGGKLIYSTCTWRAEENQDVADRFLQMHPQFIKTLEKTYWPDLDGTDGFYICRMERQKKI